MTLSARRGNRSPVLGDTPDVPRDIKNLADDLDDAPAYARGTLALRPTSGRFTSDIYWVTDDLTMGPDGTPWVWNAGAWKRWSPASDPVASLAGSRSLGHGANQALAGNDAAVTNARTPLSHAASHRQGGSDKIGGIIPIGGMIDYWGASDPADTDWLIPDGRALNSVADPTLAGLYALIGTAHGGTSSSNFFLPNPAGRFIMMKGTATPAVNGGTAHSVPQKGGEESHTLVTAEIAAHSHGGATGSANMPNPQFTSDFTHFLVDTAFTYHAQPGYGADDNVGGGNNGAHVHPINSDGGGGAHNTLPPFMVANKLMRVR